MVHHNDTTATTSTHHNKVEERHQDNRAGDSAINRDVQSNVNAGASDTLVGYHNVASAPKEILSEVKAMFTGHKTHDAHQGGIANGVDAPVVGRQGAVMSDLGGPTTYPASAKLGDHNVGAGVGLAGVGADAAHNNQAATSTHSTQTGAAPVVGAHSTTAVNAGSCNCGHSNCKCKNIDVCDCKGNEFSSAQNARI